MEKLDLSLNKPMNGYYFYTPKVDYFFITDFCKYKRKNPYLVALIDKCLKDNGCTYRGTTGCFQLKDMLQRGTIELKTCSHGDYYSIKGDGYDFGNFLKNRETKIYQV
jgi:hypothetical protein